MANFIKVYCNAPYKTKLKVEFKLDLLTVFYYENESAVAYVNGNEVMRITADGSLRLSDGNGFTATISPRQLAALVATIN